MSMVWNITKSCILMRREHTSTYHIPIILSSEVGSSHPISWLGSIIDKHHVNM